jgi:zinc protease
MGGVYGVGVYGWVTRVPTQRRVFTIRFGCAPENVKALKKAVFTEIARLQKDGVAPDYLEKVKETRRRTHETQVRSNEFWLDVLGEAAEFGDDPHAAVALEPLLGRADGDHVKAAAKRFLSTKQYVVGTMLPVK